MIVVSPAPIYKLDKLGRDGVRTSAILSATLSQTALGKRFTLGELGVAVGTFERAGFEPDDPIEVGWASDPKGGLRMRVYVTHGGPS